MQSTTWALALKQLAKPTPKTKDEVRRAYLTQKNREWRERQKSKLK